MFACIRLFVVNPVFYLNTSLVLFFSLLFVNVPAWSLDFLSTRLKINHHISLSLVFFLSLLIITHLYVHTLYCVCPCCILQVENNNVHLVVN